MYNVKTLIVDQVKSMLQNGDDNKNNWVCVFQNGDIELLSGPRPSMDGLLFRLSSFAAGNHYVGPTVDDTFAQKVFNTIKEGWKFCENHRSPYPITIDIIY